ncbi:MAG: AhpC/TSA family protein [Bacteroides sp.]|nr:AhpC/TSA family protein [Bacteroides sp.]
MKRLVKAMWSGALAVAVMTSCSEEKKGYTLEGEVEGVQNGVVYLMKSVEKRFEVVDSAQVKDGVFKLTGCVDEPMAYGITTVKDSRRPQMFFLDNESVWLKLNEAERTLDITGSPINDLYKQNVSQIRTKGFSIDSLITAHPASAVPAYFLANSLSYQFDLQQLKELRGKFDASLDGSAYIKQLEGIIARLENVQVGAVAPDFTLPDTEGNPVSLSSFRGQYVLIDFWASWCPDCRKENPNIVAAWNKYKDKNFTVLGVSLDRAREPWLAAIEKDGLTWTHVSDLKDWSSEVAVQYAIRWIPTSYLLNPDGVILAVGLEGEDLMNKLEEILKNK